MPSARPDLHLRIDAPDGAGYERDDDVAQAWQGLVAR
jgi:hypothetical protein